MHDVKHFRICFTYEENNKQNCDHPISKHDTEGNSNADSKHEHRLKEQCQVIVYKRHVQCWVPKSQVVIYCCSCCTHDHTYIQKARIINIFIEH